MRLVACRPVCDWARVGAGRVGWGKAGHGVGAILCGGGVTLDRLRPSVADAEPEPIQRAAGHSDMTRTSVGYRYAGGWPGVQAPAPARIRDDLQLMPIQCGAPPRAQRPAPAANCCQDPGRARDPRGHPEHISRDGMATRLLPACILAPRPPLREHVNLGVRVWPESLLPLPPDAMNILVTTLADWLGGGGGGTLGISPLPRVPALTAFLIVPLSPTLLIRYTVNPEEISIEFR